MKARNIRRVSQLFFLALFLYLVYSTMYSGEGSLRTLVPVDFFIRIDPLVAGAAMIAARTVIPAMLISLVVVGITLLLGRVFCGWVCPLGAALDVSDRIFYRKRGKRKDIRLRRLKYYILGGLLVTSVLTMQLVYLLDPLSLLTRTMVIGIFAPVQMALRWFTNLTYDWSYSSIGPVASAGMWMSDRMAGWQFVSSQMYYRQAFIVLAVFLAIVGLNSLSRRFWCRNLCPLGALLGLLSQTPLLKRVVSSCSECARCSRDCRMAAIPNNPRLTRSTECIECFDCVEACPRDTVSFKPRPRPSFQPETAIDPSRRRVLQGVGVGLAFVAVAKIDPGRKHAQQAPTVRISSPALIRPPGSVPESEFVNRCVRCGECMKVCPTSGLQPAIHEAGIEGFWTPVLVPRIGPCTEKCNACGQVCPTDAIKPFAIADKKNIFIGTANIDRSTCLAWYADKVCLVCDEYCPYDAIVWKIEDGMKRPHVDEQKCTGCGVCESACPVQPLAAVRVSSQGDRREQGTLTEISRKSRGNPLTRVES